MTSLTGFKALITLKGILLESDNVSILINRCSGWGHAGKIQHMRNSWIKLTCHALRFEITAMTALAWNGTDLSLVLISGYIHTVCFPLSRVSCRSGCLYHSAPAWSWKLTAQTRWSMKSGNPPPGHTRHSWGEQPDTAYMCWPLWWCTHLNLEPRTAIHATMCNYSHSNIIWECLMATFLLFQVKLWRGFQWTKQHEMTI